jgi:hypothetical protein
MSIRELAMSDAPAVAGGFIYRWDGGADFGQTIYIDIMGPIPTTPLIIPTIIFDDMWGMALNCPTGWIDYGYDMGGAYITGFSMNDSYGGEPSI